MKKIVVINDPNLNLLRRIEISIYGEKDLKTIEKIIVEEGKKFDFQVEFFQSNHEGEIIDKIHEGDNFDGIIINPGGYSHTSIAILDAIKSIKAPVIEVHLSNVFKREDFRRDLITGSGAKGVVLGLGYISYLAAIYSLYLLFKEEKV